MAWSAHKFLILKKARVWLPLAFPLPDLNFEAKITNLTLLINYKTSREDDGA
jgi:hypothetical protein